MDTSSRDRISVDLQGLKAAVLARAHALKVSPSDLIRSAVRQAVEVSGSGSAAPPSDGRSATAVLAISPTRAGARIRVCLRMDVGHAVLLTLAAKRHPSALVAHPCGPYRK